MNIIKIDKFAFRIPEMPARYRANCAREWGQFVMGDTSKITSLEAEKAGLTKGKFVEMALCWIDRKTLTFEPNYLNEPFTEIWGIPVAGGMKEQFHANCSELSTFLIHRRSKDGLNRLIESFSREAFNEWADNGMKGNAKQFAISKANEAYFSNIFRFEMVMTEGNYGTYFYVNISYRQPENELEQAALKAARQIYDGQNQGLGYCTDLRLEENHQQCQLALARQTESSNVLPKPKT